MDVKVLTTMEEIKTYSDPYRLKILHVFRRFGKPATVKEIADELGELPAKVHYHVKKLEKIGLLSLVDTKEINGIIAKYYAVFSGEIEIGQKNIEDDEVKDVIVAEHVHHLGQLFDRNKINYVERNAEDSSSVHLFNRSLYMTDTEAEALHAEIIKLCEPYFRKRKGADQAGYDVFATFVRNKEK
ncbi:helix-turn-helix domain-containing protein [Paenibacillus sp. Marseille-Q4541]|uniref:winged helix-turn-helix domain-containing protein n=1 Tax=Paenibacillus sp. Marseille-Q4541 TaxID=2831522 RepID=UPI001BA82F4E|nr:helix-turn-helix domain-containing protein [Paenibacillus sp. Marseille-Q4541]